MTSSGKQSALPIRADALVLENRCEGANNFAIKLRVPGWPGAEAGQFLMLSAGARGAVERSDPLLPRPMAVYRGHAPAVTAEGAEVEVLYKASGRGTRLIAECRPGDRMRLVGPLGRGFAPVPDRHTALLVGGGTGVASLYELAARAVGRAEVHVILGARSVSDLMGRADFAALDAELHITTEDGSDGLHGRATDALAPLLKGLADPRNATVYACGPTPMMRACAQLAAASGVACVVSLENNMACGFGVCLGCAVPLQAGGFSLICREGPVLSADDVAWEGLP